MSELSKRLRLWAQDADLGYPVIGAGQELREAAAHIERLEAALAPFAAYAANWDKGAGAVTLPGRDAFRRARAAFNSSQPGEPK